MLNLGRSFYRKKLLGKALSTSYENTFMNPFEIAMCNRFFTGHGFGASQYQALDELTELPFTDPYAFWYGRRRP
jgi:hypothetical protein